MKLEHFRHFNGEPFISVNHYCHKDELAPKLAKAIRSEVGARARVVHDACGITHVFVALGAETAARAVAMRPEFNQ